MKIAIITLGCRINQAESSQMGQFLQNSGHQIVEISEKPDICVINTCAVTARATSQSKQLVNKALNGNAKVIVTGCYVELDKDELKKNSRIEIVGNSQKSNIVNMIPASTLSVQSGPHSAFRNRPIIKVQVGCNSSCSYCVIPLARGRSKSVPIDEILNEAKCYESLNYKEIVLSGIHLGMYGLDFSPRVSLSTLIKNLLKNTNIPRIRLSSLEISEIDNELLELLLDERMCNHLHVPLQSGDDNILKLMNRTYKSKDYISKVLKVKEVLPDMAIGADIIAGFPGEGQKEFHNTKSVIECLDFSYLHVFPYSSRPGTKALKMPGHVPDPVKKERVKILRELGMDLKIKYIRGHIDKTLDIIVENESGEGVFGTTRNYIKVHLGHIGGIEEGMLVNARISGHKKDIATGTLVTDPQPLHL